RSQPPRRVEREALVAADERAVLGRERRKAHQLDAEREVDARRELAARDEDDVERLAERGGERERPHQVPEPERVLAVEEEARPRHASSRRHHAVEDDQRTTSRPRSVTTSAAPGPSTRSVGRPAPGAINVVKTALRAVRTAETTAARSRT